MNIKRTIFLIITLVAGAILWPVESLAYTGEGTEEKPWVVTTWSDLYDCAIQTIFLNSGTFYIILDSDITCDNQSQNLFFEKKVVINLNGHTLDRGLSKSEARGAGYVVGGQDLTIIGPGTITGGHSSSSGGALISSTQMTLRGCTITGNKATGDNGYGGAIKINNGSVTIEEGTIISNNNSPYGGAIYIQGGTLTINGGQICNNTCGKTETDKSNGGGIYIAGGVVIMNRGTICNNSVIGNKDSNSGFGGGVYQSNGTFNLNGGIIENNTCAADKNGGGIYDVNYSILNVSGNPIIRNNRRGNLESGALDNLFLKKNKTISITNSLDANARIGITLESHRIFTNGNNGEWHVSNFVPDDPYCFVSEKEGNAYYSSYWSDLQDRLTNCEDGSTILLDQDYVASNTDTQNLTVPNSKTITIDFNGYKIDRNMGNSSSASGYVINVKGNLTIKDTYTGNERVHTIMVDGSPITIRGGLITGGNSSSSYCGAIYVQEGSLTMEGGTIAGNRSTSTVGGVYVTGTFSMTGGSICYNTGKSYGAVNHSGNGVFNISGSPIITNNRNVNGDENNVYLSSNKKITVNGELSSTALIGVSMQTIGVFTNGLTNNGSAKNFKSDNNDYEPTLNNSGEAQLERHKFKYAIWNETNKQLYFTYRLDNLSAANSFTLDGGVGRQEITQLWVDDDVLSGTAWNEAIKDQVEEIVFGSSFINVYPTSCSNWFKDCVNLTSITGLSNLNTSEVTDMSGMFQNCSNLTSLTLDESFSTAALTTFSDMFTGSSLEDGTGTLVIKGEENAITNITKDIFISIANGKLERRNASNDLISEIDVDKNSANTGLYTWKGGVFASYNGNVLLTINTVGNGSIDAPPGATAISEGSNTYEIAPNSAITLTVTPNPRYKLKSLSYNDGESHDITEAKAFTMPSGPVTVSATFTADFDPVDTTRDYDASTNPYAIKTVADLKKLSDYVNNGVEEVRDGYIKVVDVTELDFYGINDCVPIGTDAYPFTGSFDGNNVLIKNLKIDRGDADLCGLFGRVQMGSNHNNKALQNIKIDASCEFKTTGSHVGALAGHRESIKMINCHNMGASVSGTNFVGAIVGGGVLQANDSGNTYDGSLVVATINGTKYWGCGYGVGGNQETSSPSDYAQFTSTTIGGFYGAEGNEDQVTWSYDAVTKTLLIKGSGSVSETSPWATYIGAATNNYTLNTEGVNLGDEVTTDADGYFVWHNKQFTSYNQQRSVFIKSNEGGTVTKEPSTATIGGTVTLTIQANPGYLIATKTAEYTDDNGQKQSLEFRQISNNTFSFTMPAYPVTIDVSFRTYFDLEDPTKPYEWLYNCYSIKTVEDVLKFSEFVNAGVEYCQTSFFRLPAEATFDFSNVDNFIPIGTEEHPFKGTFSTATMLVKSLHVHTTNGYCGFFGYTDDANLQGFEFEDCTFESEGDYVGALVGYCKDSRVRFDYNKDSSVKGRKYVGGLIGYYNSSDMMWTNSVGYDAEGNEGLPMTVEGDAFVGAVVGNATGTLKENIYNGYTVSIKVAGEERKYFGIGTCDDTNGILTRDLGTNVLASTVTGGFCGASGNENNVKWIYDKGTNTLLIKGSGDVEKYNASTAPWKKYVSSESNLKTEGVDISAEVTVSEGSFIWCELPFKTFNNQEPQPETISYSQALEWATYYDNCDLTLPEGFEAYYVSNVNTSGDIGSVTLTSTGQKVFKDMPMLIHKTDEKTTGIMIKTTHGEIAPTTDTRFKGTAEDITSLSAEDITIYVLRDGMFIPAKASSMTAHKCWLEISKAAGTRGFVINIDNECISSEALEGPGHWYDLNGRPLPTKPRQKGLYIHDGKKTVIK